MHGNISVDFAHLSVERWRESRAHLAQCQKLLDWGLSSCSEPQKDSKQWDLPAQAGPLGAVRTPPSIKVQS